ncbi:MAG: efflux RND transporter permease subunit, partial [Flavobacteriales bacterium]
MIIVMSIVGYNTLSRDSMPPYTVRVATVVTSFPGAGPERVESLISDKIEKVVQELPELDYVSSQSRTGLSVIVVALKDNVKAIELQPVWDKLRRKIDGIRNDLPSGIYGPEVKDEDVGVVYGIMLGMESDGFEYAQIKEYADNLKDKLIALENAAKVEIGGEIEERVYIEFNDSELAKYGLSGSQLKNNISSTNIIIAAGEVKLGNERIILEPSGNLESIEDIKNILVPIGDGETIKLNDLTTVRRDYISPKETMVLINGNPALSLSISLKKGANIIQLGETVNELLIDYNKTLPLGLSVTRIASQDTDVEYNISNFVSNVMQSIVIVLLVMFIFLGLRTGLVVASLIPLVILCTLLIMGVLNVGLNQVSLAALIMALGMLVDNAIVIAETMMVKMEKGTKAITAAIESSSELMFPLLISSLTTSAAFLAFYLAESVMGEVMGELFVVITIALLSSWLMALTIIPLLAIKMIRIKESKDQKPSIFDKLNVYYNKLLKISIKKPLITIGIIVICFFVSLVGFKMIPVNFMPDSERNLVTLDLNLPLGTSIESTQEEIKKIETYIKETL